MKVNGATIGLALGLIIFFIIVSIWVSHLINPKEKLLSSLGSINFTIFLLLGVQFVYLLSHILEKITEKNIYSIASYIFMIILGGLLLTMYFIDNHFRNTHILVESLLYLGTGITLLILELKDKKDEKNEKDEKKENKTDKE